MSVCTLPPGGVSPGASRWSAAPADDGAAFPITNAARTSAPTAANSTASPIVLFVANLDDTMILSLLPVCDPCPAWGASCSPHGAVRFDGRDRVEPFADAGRTSRRDAETEDAGGGHGCGSRCRRRTARRDLLRLCAHRPAPRRGGQRHPKRERPGLVEAVARRLLVRRYRRLRPHARAPRRPPAG